MTKARIPLAAVIGSPVSHSKSPQLHGHWLATYGLRGQYVPIDVTASDLEKVIGMMPKMGFVGANVTIPYKERILDLADQITDRAMLIGAANTLVFCKDGKIIADNTDGYGFLENIRQALPDWNARAGSVAVLGAGGACRAVIVALLDAGVPEITLTNRTRARADRLKQDFDKRLRVVEWAQAGTILKDAALVVNTTCLGMTGKPELQVPLDGLQSGAVVAELVYTPLQTPLLKAAEEAGCRIVDGLGMLLHQAVPGFERWFGIRPAVNASTRTAVLR